MERWLGRVALVTGASAGIGTAICEALVKHGMKVIGCARNITKIQEVSGKLAQEKGKLFAIKCDISKEEEVLEMFKQIRDQHGGVDVCINNAGLSYDAPLLTGTTEQWRHMFEVNVLGLCICTREAYASMKQRDIKDGQIIHISSISGYKVTPIPSVHFYCATKQAVRALLTGLRNEMKETDTNIRVAEISPGRVETEFTIRMFDEETARSLMAEYKWLDPQDIANAVVYIISAPPHVEIHDILIRPVKQKEK